MKDVKGRPKSKNSKVLMLLRKWVKVKVTQSCLTLCNPMDYKVHGILQARILEWVAIPFSRGSSQPRDRTQVSRIAGIFSLFLGFPGGSAGKESTCSEGDLGLIPGLGRSPEEGKGYPFQYPGLENAMDCIAPGVAKSQT